MVTVSLNAAELGILGRQHPSTKNRGGWQQLLVSLQERVNPKTGTITLTAADIERIERYAFGYGKGGWETRLRGVFERTLGPDLNGRQRRAA